MNEKPPSSMIIELEDKDVERDLTKILGAMALIRAEAVQNRQLDDGQRDEYLHLTYRLASGMKALADEKTVNKMQLVAERLSENPQLQNYDPFQEDYWDRKEPDFTGTLDELLIGVMKDSFDSIDKKHHVLQAVKYLGVENSSEKRKEVYDTILPFYGALELKQGFGRSILARLFGETHKVERVDDLTLQVNTFPEDLEGLIEFTQDLGYKELRLNIPKDSLGELKEEYPKAQVVGKAGKARSNSNRTRRTAAKAFKYFCPLTVPLSGALPDSIREKVHDYLRPELSWLDGDINKGSEGTLDLAEFLLSAGLQIAAGFSSSYFVGGRVSVGLGLYFVAEGIARLVYASKTDDFPGTLAGKLLLSPLEIMLRKNNSKKELVNVSIPTNTTQIPQNIQSPHEYYQQIAELNVPPKISRNLQWSSRNHNGFGKKFFEYVNGEIGKPELPIKRLFDRENNFVAYHHEAEIDYFTKHSSLFCYNGKTYQVTSIAYDRDNDFLRKAGKILGSKQEIGEKLTQLAGKTGSKYLHVKEYKKEKLTQDMEVTA